MPMELSLATCDKSRNPRLSAIRTDPLVFPVGPYLSLRVARKWSRERRCMVLHTTIGSVLSLVS
jgi:hypothetical protein